MRIFIALSAALLLSACGAMSVERAESTCVEDAKAARGPTGTLAIGTTTEGPRVKGDVTISTDWIGGRDPEEVYVSCVMRRAGKVPEHFLRDRPEWRP